MPAAVAAVLGSKVSAQQQAGEEIGSTWSSQGIIIAFAAIIIIIITITITTIIIIILAVIVTVILIVVSSLLSFIVFSWHKPVVQMICLYCHILPMITPDLTSSASLEASYN